jgi:hypothetical protein
MLPNIKRFPNITLYLLACLDDSKPHVLNVNTMTRHLSQRYALHLLAEVGRNHVASTGHIPETGLCVLDQKLLHRLDVHLSFGVKAYV